MSPMSSSLARSSCSSSFVVKQTHEGAHNSIPKANLSCSAITLSAARMAYLRTIDESISRLVYSTEYKNTPLLFWYTMGMQLRFPARIPGDVHDLLFGKGSFAERLKTVEKRYGHAFSLKGIPFWVHTAMHIMAAIGISLLLLHFSLMVHQMVVGALVFFFAFQEFSVHPRVYGQHRTKSVADFLSWSVPLVLMFTVHQ